MNTGHILIGVLVAINVLTLFVTANDKRKSMRGTGAKRTSEGFLFFLATCFGSVGVYAAMLLFRHKTKKWYFQLGIPLLILQNLASAYLLYTFLEANALLQ